MRRREFLTRAAAGVSGVAGVIAGALASGRTHGRSAARASASGQPPYTPDVEFELRAGPGTVSLAQGPATRVWKYSGRVVRGPASALQVLPDSYLGPILRLQTGQRVRIHFKNELPEDTIVHWHGLDVPAEMDGHPRLAIASGKTFVYEFEIVNRAGTYWYHPHPHMRTGPQVNMGLAGMILVSDAAEARLKLPSGPEEIVCVLQDRQLDARNQLSYVSDMPMDRMTGFLGDRVFVNGRPAAPLSLATRAYRLRLMNGSNARVYKLAWSDATPMTVIGTDGGLLERPVERPYVTLAPAERADVIIDLTRRDVGSRVTLRSLPFPARPFEMQMMGMGMGMGRGRGRGGAVGTGGKALPPGAPMDILPIVVERRERSIFTLPTALSSYDDAWTPTATVPTRVVEIDFRMMRFLLNGREFDLEDVASDERIRAGTTHVWELDNSQPGMMGMRLAHPIHLHGRQFRVLSRRIDPALAADWRALSDGFVDEGWKDTVLVMPGERVRILVRFSKHAGLYLYHCHNLEHEDAGMMCNYRLT
jgi:FtsP/CotA-like multicopper oxidase with cupredoxin domain